MERSDFILLSILGDGKVHTYREVEWMYRVVIKDNLFKKSLSRLLEYFWIRRNFNRSKIELDSYTIGRKGDLALREEQIRRSGDYDYFKQNSPRPLAM